MQNRRNRAYTGLVLDAPPVIRNEKENAMDGIVMDNDDIFFDDLDVVDDVLLTHYVEEKPYHPVSHHDDTFYNPPPPENDDDFYNGVIKEDDTTPSIPVQFDDLDFDEVEKVEKDLNKLAIIRLYFQISL